MSPKAYLLSFALAFTVVFPTLAQEGFIGEIRLFAGNFAPRNWAFCDGQTLSIRQHETLFSILGTQYGGDGRTTFALPRLTPPGEQTTASLPTTPPIRRSQPGGAPVTVTFFNRTAQTLSTEWISWEGELVKYTDIPPGGQWTVNSATQQFWRFSHGTSHVQDVELVANRTQYEIMPSATASGPINSGPRYIICLRGVYPARN
jgi:microcystin-dependent protein